MASIRSLVDTFGPPPHEICLDWAVQINAWVASRDAFASDPGMSDRSSQPRDPQVDWTALEIASDGRLPLNELTASMAQRALVDLREWLAHCTPHCDMTSLAALPVGRDIADDRVAQIVEPAAETSGVNMNVGGGALTGESPPARVAGKSPAKVKTGWWTNRPHRAVALVAMLAAVGVVITSVWITSAGGLSRAGRESAKSTAPSQDEHSSTFSGSSESSDAETNGDYLKALDGDALASGWTTSRELTQQALDASSAESRLSSETALSPELNPWPAPSLPPGPAPLSSAATTPSSTDADTDNDRSTSANPSDAAALATAADTASVGAVQDVMGQVATALALAERQSAVPPEGSPQPESSPSPSDSTALTGDTDRQHLGDEAVDWSHQLPLMLTRDMRVLRPEVPRGVGRVARESQWAARIEVSGEFVCEPATLQRLASRSRVDWRIYERDAQSPRACLIVSVYQRSERDVGLEWSLHGGAEDLPDLRLPVERKSIDSLSAQLKITAVSLHSLIESSSGRVPREMRSLMQQQRQYAQQQLVMAERLVSTLAQVDRLASLVDGELLAHAELRTSEQGSPVLTYGTCEREPPATEN